MAMIIIRRSIIVIYRYITVDEELHSISYIQLHTFLLHILIVFEVQSPNFA